MDKIVLRKLFEVYSPTVRNHTFSYRGEVLINSKLSKFMLSSLILICAFQPFSNIKAEESNYSKLATTLAVSFILGNVVSWLSGAWPEDIPYISYTNQEQAYLSEMKKELRLSPEDSELLTDIGAIHFRHNELDDAEKYLERARKINRNNSETQAWYSANQTKQAGAMLDFTWGFRKLYLLKKGVAELEHALNNDPENMTIRLIHLNTNASIGTRSKFFFKVFDDEIWFNQRLEKNPNYFPNEVRQQFYLSIANSYLKLIDQKESSSAKRYSFKQANEYIQKLHKENIVRHQFLEKFIQLNEEIKSQKYINDLGDVNE